MVSEKILFEFNNPLKTGTLSGIVVITNRDGTDASTKTRMEEAYYNGQKDYAEGKIKIQDPKYNHCYVWTESPWENDSLGSIKYQPECLKNDTLK
jgi:hypothetical protein